MKELKSAPLVALVAVGSSTTLASAASKPSSKPPHVIQLPIVRDANRYIAEITVGTPPQKINMTIDTGIAFTWLLSSDANLCQSHLDNRTVGKCATVQEKAEKFNSSASWTFKPHQSDGFAAYRNGHHVQGYQSSETLNLDGITVAHFQFNMIQNSTLDSSGTLGLGYLSQPSHQKKHIAKQRSVLDSMLKEGAISHKAYSIHLSDAKNESGSILFGGMDVDKFHGPLKELPIVPHTDAKGQKSYHALQVMMTSLDLSRDRSLAFNYTSILDPASRISHLPKRVFEPIYELIQNSKSDTDRKSLQEMRYGQQSLYLVDCNIRERLSDTLITIGFGGLDGASIEVPLQDLILTAPNSSEEDGPIHYGETGRPLMKTHCACYLAINRSPMVTASNTAEITVLGNAFLSRAYIVYDLQNNIIGMAPRNFDSITTNIVEFRKGMHPDCNPGNFFVTTTSGPEQMPQVTAIIDWERVGYFPNYLAATTPRWNQHFIIGDQKEPTEEIFDWQWMISNACVRVGFPLELDYTKESLKHQIAHFPPLSIENFIRCDHFPSDDQDEDTEL
ncbi:hypothetical protein IFR05_002626 [Cadophora sp. M221]|nr:hypothetical protein IFR05_002626 [Cadophora sp. M221]